jgi:integrase/recombinase XerD
MFKVLINRKTEPGTSPYRLIDIAGTEVREVNGYLDSVAVRGLSERTTRIYAYDLLNFWTWLVKEDVELQSITRSSLYEYIRWQRQGDNPSPATINHRLVVVKCLYEHLFDRIIPVSVNAGNESISRRPWIGYKRIGHMYPARKKELTTRVKEPYKVVVPLTHKEVGEFFSSFESWRDITICGFMLFCGLRSKEVISLMLDDISIFEEQTRVQGKGNKERIVPMPKNLIEVLGKYLKLERPKTESSYLFVVLKGPNRGNPLTSGGLYKIFRYHRKASGIKHANPHRFRHTFGADMTRAGISVLALMRLMGHSHVQTTMRYVNLFAEDIRIEFNKAVSRLHTREIINESKTDF